MVVELDQTQARLSRSPSRRSWRDRSSASMSDIGTMSRGFDFDLTAHSKKVLSEEEYDVSKFYKTTGLAQAIARNEVFLNLTMLVIVLNIVYIGIDLDLNKEDTLSNAPLFYQFCEHFFCAYFVLEWMVRFFAFESKKEGFMVDWWFRFDSLLAGLSVAETWLLPQVLLLLGSAEAVPMGPVRLLRLARLARMARLLRYLPELVTMMKGMIVATRAVGSSLILLALMTYVFAILTFMLLGEESDVDHYFGTLSVSMWTLLIDGCLMDSIGALTRALLSLHWVRGSVSVILFMCFALLSSMTVMNMLIGILCEVVSAVAAAEKENAAISLMKKSLLVMLKRIDADGSGEISKEELMSVIDDPEALMVLDNLQVSVDYFMDFQEMLYEDPEAQHSIGDIMEHILGNRGHLPCTVNHLENMQRFLCWSISKEISRHFKRPQAALDEIRETVHDLAEHMFVERG